MVGKGRRPASPAAPKADPHGEVTRLYAENYHLLIRFLVARGAEPEVAEDVLQDVFAGLCMRWDHLDQIEFPTAYLFIAVKRRLWDHRRQFERRHDLVDQLPDDAEAIFPVADEIEARLLIVDALTNLPPQQSKVMALAVDGYKPTEIAGALGIARVTVNRHLGEARDRLRRDLRDDFPRHNGRRTEFLNFEEPHLTEGR